MSIGKTSRAMLSAPKKLLLLLVILGLSLFLLEGLSRCWLLIADQPQSPSAIKKEIEELKSAFTQSIPTPEKLAQPVSDPERPDQGFLHPYYGLEFNHGLRSQTKFGVSHPTAQRSNDYNILVVGGSVAARFLTLSWNCFAKKLGEDPLFRRKRIRAIHFARGGFKQPQQATMVAYLLAAGITPHAVINIDGFNEVNQGLINAGHDMYPLYPSITHWGPLVRNSSTDPQSLDLLIAVREHQREGAALADTALRYGFHYSGILGRYTLIKLHRAKEKHLDTWNRYLARIITDPQKRHAVNLPSPEFDQEQGSMIDLIVDAWREGSISIDAMCKARSIPYLHVLQPTLHDEGAKPVTEEEMRKGAMNPAWINGVRLGYPRFREEGRTLKERGVHFADCSRVFQEVEETIYFDYCHFAGIGTEIFGLAVAEAFLTSLSPP